VFCLSTTEVANRTIGLAFPQQRFYTLILLDLHIPPHLDEA